MSLPVDVLASQVLQLPVAERTKLLVDNPGIGTPINGVRRVHRLRNFPYSLLHRETEPGSIRLLVVRHQHRDPAFGETEPLTQFSACAPGT